MINQDWLVTGDGRCEAWEESADNLELSTGQYRLYRFLTDLEDILHKLMINRLDSCINHSKAARPVKKVPSTEKFSCIFIS
ncbi:hypothetical protein [Scytonema sp. UIC 10036]|uniref:hypothetical protein n=1 Tax=Scytonema sp. UIC 10036 TaxID=2304196 RepID=UPI001FA99D81|nr:hypothetical protein [Scytonema sp. UIC 10036]